MYGENWRRTQQKYRQHREQVKAVFQNQFTPGLVDRMAGELNEHGQTYVCETIMQHDFLRRALNGEACIYDARQDPELAELFEDEQVSP